jgi:hypothetical protein
MVNLAINELLSDPLYFPFQLICDRQIGYLKISEDTFKKSSFLDRRIFGVEGEMIFLSASEVERQLRELTINTTKDLIHIFHISHVGSTFISKLLESLNEVKVLREPNILRDFTREYSKVIKSSSEYKKHELDSILFGILKSFTHGRESKVVIKHTSSNLGLPIGHNHIENIVQKEILLYTDLKNFLSHAITSNGLRSDAEGNARIRLNYLNKICFSNFFNLDDLKFLQIVSLIWMVEFSKILARKASNKNALLINFDYDFKENQKKETLTKIIGYIFNGNFNNLDEMMHLQDWNINPKNGEEFCFEVREDAIKRNKISSKKEIEKVSNWVMRICKEETYLMPLLNHIK